MREQECLNVCRQCTLLLNDVGNPSLAFQFLLLPSTMSDVMETASCPMFIVPCHLSPVTLRLEWLAACLQSIVHFASLHAPLGKPPESKAAALTLPSFPVTKHSSVGNSVFTRLLSCVGAEKQSHGMRYFCHGVLTLGRRPTPRLLCRLSILAEHEQRLLLRPYYTFNGLI